MVKSGFAARKKKLNYWTEDEDAILLHYANVHQERNWKEIASHIPTKSDIQCSARYKRIQPGLVKGSWTPEENEKLILLVDTYGRNWSKISEFFVSRTGKQIRDRYLNSLDPEINHDKFTVEEDYKILECYERLGTKWSLISDFFPDRTADMIKNRFYSKVKREMPKMKKNRLNQEVGVRNIKELPETKENPALDDLLKNKESGEQYDRVIDQSFKNLPFFISESISHHNNSVENVFMASADGDLKSNFVSYTDKFKTTLTNYLETQNNVLPELEQNKDSKLNILNNLYEMTENDNFNFTDDDVRGVFFARRVESL